VTDGQQLGIFVAVDGFPDGAIDAAGLFGDDEQLAGVMAAGAFDAVGGEAQRLPAGLDGEGQGTGAQASTHACAQGDASVVGGARASFPDDGGELAVAGSGDDDSAVGAGVKPPGDDAGHEIVLADRIPRVNNGIAILSDGVGDLGLSRPVGRSVEDDVV